MTAPTDHLRLVEALHQLAPSIRRSTDGSWHRAPALRVIDCVLSLNRSYDRFVVRRLDRFELRFPEVVSIFQLCSEITKYKTPHEFVVQTLDYRHAARADILLSVAQFLASISGNGPHAVQLAMLESWAESVSCEGHRNLGIDGFGLAGFQYLRMLFGANTTKPDLRICQWVAEAVGHPVSPIQALRLLERAAPDAGVNLRDADTTIWEMLARGPGRARKYPEQNCSVIAKSGELMEKKNKKLAAEAAEFLVLGNLLVEEIQAYKMYVNMPGYDVLAVNPDSNRMARVSVKSRWRAGAKGFIINNFDCDFVVVAKLNKGAPKPSAPQFYVIPTDAISSLPRFGWGKLNFSAIPNFQDYLNAWHLIRDFIGLPPPSEPEEDDGDEA